MRMYLTPFIDTYSYVSINSLSNAYAAEISVDSSCYSNAILANKC